MSKKFSNLKSQILNLKSLKGFTLIELMVAVTIVAVMATIGLALYSNMQKVARDSKRVSDLEEIRKAAEAMRIATGAYPTTLAAMASYFERAAAPTDPSGGGAYIYQNLSERYIACATLENCGTATNPRCTNSGVASSTTAVTAIGTLASTNTQLCVGN